MKTLVARRISVLLVLSGYLAPFLWADAQNAPRITGIRPLTNRETALSIAVSNGAYNRIEVSTNLSSWNALATFGNTGSSLQHTDTAAPYLDLRYYRAQQLTGTNELVGDHLNATYGDVVIQPRRHATFVMSWNGKMIYNDPDDLATYSGLPKADLILISHDHSDHLSVPTIESVRKTNAIIIAPLAVYNNSSMTPTLRSNTIVLNYGVSTNVLGLTVEAVPGYNSNHPFGINNAYLITIGGKRIFTSGDSGAVAEIRALTNIDVAFIAINLPFTMSVADAASLVREFRPKVVYPYHFSPSTPTTDLNDFKRRVGQDVGVEVRLRKWY
jgi:L-ascorbate metabolism protein UlaG (beta-lactamase superfamily)